jgi:hypothetical protein
MKQRKGARRRWKRIMGRLEKCMRARIGRRQPSMLAGDQHVEAKGREEEEQERRKGLLGSCFVAEGPLSRNTFKRSTYKQTQRKGTCQSYDPGSFGIVTCLKTKGCTDLKRKRPINP